MLSQSYWGISLAQALIVGMAGAEDGHPLDYSPQVCARSFSESVSCNIISFGRNSSDLDSDRSPHLGVGDLTSEDDRNRL